LSNHELSAYQFGRRLVETGDLDPVYILLYHAGFPRPTLRRWLLAYWCFYHVGTASKLCQETDFWAAVRAAAADKTHPRGAERRHFRGGQAVASAAWLSECGEGKLLSPIEGRRWAASDLMAAVRGWVGFGHWISFKVADMVERLGLAQVTFSGADLLLFEAPAKGAEMLHREEGQPPLGNQGVCDWAVGRVLQELVDLTAPPGHERPLNLQEAETVLCKWKSYRNGRNHVGEDTEACRRGLLRFARNRVCQTLLRAGGKGGLW